MALRRLAPDAAALYLGGLVGALGAAQGGYFPSAWGWAALAFLWPALLAVFLSRRIELGLPQLAFLGLTLALVAWIALSIAWSTSEGRAIFEVERALIYLGAVAAVALVVRRGQLPWLLAGLLIGITCVAAYALATRLFPNALDQFEDVGGRRLFRPLGYWNALGVFCAIGGLLAAGFAAYGRTILARAAAAFAAPILATTLYFTFSRGSWAALIFGAAVMLATSRHRLKLSTASLVLVALSAAALLLASRSDALTTKAPSLNEATSQGNRLALFVLGLSLAAAAAVAVLVVLERRLRISSSVRYAYIGALTAVLIAGLATAFATWGSPVRIVERAYDSFKKPPTEGTNLNRRLFTLSSNGRIELWDAAENDADDHPWIGAGSGSYETYWYVHRPSDQNVRDAHSLYLETLAELGPVGLALLAALLVVPVAVVRRARGWELAGVAAAAYGAFLLHAAVDWDWEMPAVTLTALLPASALVVAASERRPRIVIGRVHRGLLGALLVACTGFAFVALVGNTSASRAADALADGRWRDARSEARRASSWAPWAARPWVSLAAAQLAEDEHGAAVRSLLKAVERDPANYRIWLNLAYVAQGRLQAQAVERTNELNPRLELTLRKVRPPPVS
jgi:hypothetical protein